MPEEETVESTEEVAEKTEETTEETTEIVQEETPAEVETKEEESAEPPPKKKQTAQERINELTRIRREKEREAEYWRKVALEKKEPKPEPKEEPALPKRPTLDQFETTEQYEDALFEWRDNVREIKSANERREKEYESSLKEFNERAKKLRLEHEDFDEVVESPVFTPAMRETILNSEHGPEVAYHLGKPENWDLAEKIRNLPPLRQALEIGKLETQLLVTKQTKKVTQAPPPIKPVGMSGASGEKDPSKMSIEEWMEWDKQRTIEKLKKKLGG